MFTGLVQQLGSLLRVERGSQGAMTRLRIEAERPFEHLVLGESIALDGACHTVVAFSGRWFEVESTPETMRRTAIGGWSVGSKLHLERALALGERLGGHLVQGHVDAAVRLIRRVEEGEALTLFFELPDEQAPFVVEKGSVALDGVSLTVASVARGEFSVALIPETRHRTLLGARPLGARVNLETDLIGKYVARLFELRGTPPPGGGAKLEELLGRAGFV